MSKLRLKLILVLAICMVSCLFASCSIGTNTLEGYIDQYGTTAQITYYANGGYFSNAYKISCPLYMQGGNKFNNVKVSGQEGLTRSNYNLVGWYYVESLTIYDEEAEEDVLYFVLDAEDDDMAVYLDENGDYSFTYSYTYTLNGVQDEASFSTIYFTKTDEGEWIISQEDYDYYVEIVLRSYGACQSAPMLKCGEEVDTSLTVADGDQLYVVAKWEKASCIIYKLAIKQIDENDATEYITVGDTVYYEGDTLYTEYFGSSSVISRSDGTALSIGTVSDATMAKYYYDEECTQPVDGAMISKPEDEGEVVIYAQYVGGEWSMLRNYDNVKDMFGSGSGNYYLADDIDCSGGSISPMSAFDANIYGNGKTISNFTVSQTRLGDGTVVALFGSIWTGAKITDLTLSDFTISYSVSTRAQFVNFYLVGMSASGTDADSFDITGLTIKNATMTITLREYSANPNGYTIINNIQYIEGAYNSGNWLYGNMAEYAEDDGVSYTDAEFIATYGGVTLQNCTLYVVTDATYLVDTIE